ncbi:hypothetical protein ACIP9H_29440 [Streptomyces sp. NPDC088732]|uniref:hypothetical protein n=1 Tax=Streptomyces sp. NPDC088732 TaxID=3365879 RepID=UPI00380CDD14
MKPLLLGAVLALLWLLTPGVLAAALGLVAAVLVGAAGQPAVWAFIAGLAAYPRLARATRRWTR